ncbi:EcsC family protein [Clostridium nigeriense]|uniref:EcsC family protein n=1 Tax=Clostridium nigeriense TaxID=1805470 RepID=UPI00082F6EA5|nr:EcsC family protein [Clostridium nigeriense]
MEKYGKKDGGSKPISETLEEIANGVSKITSDVSAKAKDAVIKSKESFINTIDANGNGAIDIEDIIIIGLRVPGIKVNRKDFLQKELLKRYPQEVIDDAISYNPAHAKIPSEIINKIADQVIQYERNCVSGISAALGAPGGFAMAVTIPADITQYYGYMLRATQKLLYLYGFPEIDTTEKDHKFDSETMNILILCLGAMYGVSGANKALKTLAMALANGVEKKLLKAALTKGTIYPIVKNVAKWFGVNMTKKIFAGFFKKAIPVLGGVIGGGITYVAFKPCCNKLKSTLQDTLLSNPNHHIVEDENIINIDYIE